MVKIGDTVKILESSFKGRIGIVTSIAPTTTLPIHVTLFGDNHETDFRESEVENNNLVLIRVKYARKDTPAVDREYQLNGEGPVGNLDEWATAFPEKSFIILEDK